jgi:nitroimidazol reductase NimA-like FMN-containing flavoprotein (pyridoxamine 5'-phosphate oxidase superfamily)
MAGPHAFNAVLVQACGPVGPVPADPGHSALVRPAGRADRGAMANEATADTPYDMPELLRPIESWRCLQLVEAVPYGRLATVDAGRPLLVVVNHIVEDGDIYIRTRPEARLARLTENGRVVHAVYEVDSAFPAGQSGWSVMATGLLTREYGAASSARLRSRLTAWAQGERDVVLHLQVQELTGRSVGRP